MKVFDSKLSLKLDRVQQNLERAKASGSKLGEVYWQWQKTRLEGKIKWG